MSDQTPFDCRANHKATIDDISPVLLENHLRKTGSKLAKQIRKRGTESILEDMQLLVGPPELRYIQNVALMMFCEHPENFFGYTYVQMTRFPEGSTANPGLSEDFPIITGSVPQMIEATMERFRNMIIRETVIKVPGQMESLRIFNYPYQAIEEAVVNAFYHRDYTSFETSFETSLKQILSEKNYEKIHPLIKLLDQGKELSIQDVISVTGKSRATAWRYMQLLNETGLIENTGNTNNVLYRKKL